MSVPFEKCRGCKDRYPGCHAKCESYIKDRAEYDRIKAERSVGINLDGYARTIARRNSDNMAKKHRSRAGIRRPTGR